jgi:hypothetical protein
VRGIASWDLEREDTGRTHCVRSATDCNLGVVLENHGLRLRQWTKEEINLIYFRSVLKTSWTSFPTPSDLCCRSSFDPKLSLTGMVCRNKQETGCLCVGKGKQKDKKW